MADKFHWVLFSYNGNSTVARAIVGATQEQVGFFMDSGGNQDDSEEFVFDSATDCQLVCIGPDDDINDTFSPLMNHLVWYLGDQGENWERIGDLPRWILNTRDYPDGKLERMIDDDNTVVKEMEREAEKEDPEYTGRNGL